MNLFKKARPAAGDTATAAKSGRKTKAAEPKSYPDTAEGRLEAAADRVRASLDKYERGIADIAGCDTSLAALEKEVGDYLATIDPRDEQAVSLVSIKRDMIRLLPVYKEKEEVKQDERGAAFILELEAAASAILACADAEVARALDVVEAAIRPWFPPYVAPADRLHGLPQRTVDPARQVAGTSALFYNGLHTALLGAANWRRPVGGRLYGNESSVRSYDRALVDRAKQLLGICQAWQENGRAFLRQPFPPAGQKSEGAQEAALPPSAATTLPDAENAS